MDFYDAVDARRTIRDFTDDSVDEATLERIIGAGMKAPTNDHMRDWHFVVLDDRSAMRDIIARIPKTFSRETVDKILDGWCLTDTVQRDMYYDGIPKQYKMLSEAACLILPFYRQHGELLKPESLSSLNAFASIWCCMENIFLAAANEGLACAMRIPQGDEEEYIRSATGCPEGYFMPCYISLGVPARDAKFLEQKPYSLKERIHKNRW